MVASCQQLSCPQGGKGSISIGDSNESDRIGGARGYLILQAENRRAPAIMGLTVTTSAERGQ